MRLQKLELYNFRCFKKKTFDLDHNVIIIHGKNGTGKTSFVEALYYTCYARSFKTRTVLELAHEQEDHFSIIADIKNSTHDLDQHHTISCMYADKKKKIKLDQKNIRSYKDLLQYSQVITLTQDDIAIIQGGPGNRRDFLDEVLVLYKPEYIVSLRSYQKILDQRNALLKSDYIEDAMYDLWTERLFEATITIQKERKFMLSMLESACNKRLPDIVESDITVYCKYQEKIEVISGDQALSDLKERLYRKEAILQRSLFGAHLDDVSIEYLGRDAKIYGSRGQQKLLVLALKMGIIDLLKAKHIDPVVLFDDFITDFDDQKIESIIKMLEASHLQIICTTPQDPKRLSKFFSNQKPHQIDLF